MKIDRRLLLAMLLPGAALALWLGLGGLLLWATLGPEQRASVAAVVGPLAATHGILPVAWWLVAAALAAWGAFRLHAAHVAAPARLVAATRVLVGDAAAPDLAAPNGATRALADAINALAGQRRDLQQEMARRVAEASARVAEQRDQLGALMAELNQSVLVCNRDGRILLYNERARRLFQHAGREPIGLGRSVHGVIDRAVIAHARETLERRIARGGDQAAARFVTGTPGGHLISTSMAPVRSGAQMAGFVLLLDDITEAYDTQSRRDRQLVDLTEASRASLASMGAALEMLDYPDLAPEERDRFHRVVRDEVASMGTRLAELAADISQDRMTRWPLQEMLGSELVAVAAERISTDLGQAATETVDGALWLSVDSFALIQALTFLAGRFVAAGQGALQLRLAAAGGRHAHLDLVRVGAALRPEALAGWQSDPMRIGDARSALSVRDVAERHGGEVWFEQDRGGAAAFFRFLLPLAASEPGAAPILVESRPEYYDFDLFAASEGSRALDDQPLGEIAYTVFDTETTGLDPGQGDEILQIGATRIVNGRLLRGECFDQLVDPQRSIPEAGIPIHGIRPEMVRGKPVIAEVLPAFRAFCSDTVLIGHNVAFDLRFLKLKEAESGAIFDLPVLDTLLLSSIVHPGEEAHSLEAIAARLGVAVSGRHTAVGDALATAEVFLKLLPLLRQQGILTLRQAREAAQTSYYARLRY